MSNDATPPAPDGQPSRDLQERLARAEEIATWTLLPALAAGYDLRTFSGMRAEARAYHEERIFPADFDDSSLIHLARSVLAACRDNAPSRAADAVDAILAVLPEGGTSPAVEDAVEHLVCGDPDIAALVCVQVIDQLKDRRVECILWLDDDRIPVKAPAKWLDCIEALRQAHGENELMHVGWACAVKMAQHCLMTGGFAEIDRQSPPAAFISIGARCSIPVPGGGWWTAVADVIEEIGMAAASERLRGGTAAALGMIAEYDSPAYGRFGPASPTPKQARFMAAIAGKVGIIPTVHERLSIPGADAFIKRHLEAYNQARPAPRRSRTVHA